MNKKFFRIAVEGATTDGREISREWIEQMASSYNPAVYTAQINCEHFRGMNPDGPFGNFGQVLALKAEEIELDGQKKLALFAQLQPNARLLDLNGRGQKLFTSMEVSPDFAKSGKAGLVGLAVTDSPASLGTEMLQFCAGAQTNPLSDRKQDPNNVISEAFATDFTDLGKEEPEQTQEPESVTSLTERFKTMFNLNKGKTDAQVAELLSGIKTLGDVVLEQQGQLIEFKAQLASFSNPQGLDQIRQDAEKALATVNQIKAALDNQDFGEQRPPALGGNGNLTTDC